MTSRTITSSLAGLALLAGLSGCAGGLFGGGDKDNVTPTVGNRVPILSRVVNDAQVDPALASVSVVLPPAEVNTEWAQGGGTANKAYGHLALSPMTTSFAAPPVIVSLPTPPSSSVTV